MALSNLIKVVNPNATVQTNTNQSTIQAPPPVSTQAPKKVYRSKPTAPLQSKNVSCEMPIGLELTWFCPELDGGRFLKKVELWFGNPSTGKTTKAKLLAQRLKDDGIIDDFIVINCHEEMTVMSMLKTTKTDENGNWVFEFNKIFNALTDALKKKYLIIYDEFNTLPMSVDKSLQPLLDDTEGEFDFEDKTYEKNPNVQFILTLNHNDIGTTPIPEAIKSRAFPVEFEDLDLQEVSKRSGVPYKIIELMGRIREMFTHLGEVPEFHKDVRQLKNIVGLTKEQFKKYITSILSFHHIEWKEAVAISPEFQNMLDEFEKVRW